MDAAHPDPTFVECPGCGAQIILGFRFCNQCGTSVIDVKENAEQSNSVLGSDDALKVETLDFLNPAASTFNPNSIQFSPAAPGASQSSQWYGSSASHASHASHTAGSVLPPGNSPPRSLPGAFDIGRQRLDNTNNLSEGGEALPVFDGSGSRRCQSCGDEVCMVFILAF